MVESTAANWYDSKPLLALLDKEGDQGGRSGTWRQDLCSQKHREALKVLGIKNGIQDKAVKNKSVMRRQLQRNRQLQRLGM